MSSNVDLDTVLDAIGMGKWQVLGLIGNVIMWGLYASHTMGATFWNPPLKFRCCSNISTTPNVPPPSLGSDEQYNNSIFFDNQCLTPLAQENVIVNTSSFDEQVFCVDHNFTANRSIVFRPTGLDTCPYVAYDDSVFSSTVMLEWDLICENSGFVSFFQDFFTIGMILGCAIGGDIGDRYGRMRTLVFSSVLHGIGTSLVVVTNNFSAVVFGRFLAGFTLFITIIAVYTWTLETCPKRYRGIVGMLVCLPYCIIVVLFALIAYYLRDWRPLYAAISWPALLVVPASWFMDESPRWLLRQGRMEEARKVIWKAARTNNAQAQLDSGHMEEALKKIITEEESAQAERERSEAKSIFASAIMMHIVIGLPLAHFFDKVQYYTTFFNANRFAGSNVFLYVALSGAVDGIAVLVAIPIIDHCGRKVATAGCAIVSGLLMLLLLTVPDDLTTIQWVISLASFYFIGTTTQVLYVYTPELFPTIIRARGFALGNLFGNFGILVAPFVPNVMGNHGWWVTGTVMGICGVTTGLILSTYPETKNEPLCETIRDVERRAAMRRNKGRSLENNNHAQVLKGPEHNGLEEAIELVSDFHKNYSSTKTEVQDAEICY